MYIIKSQGAKVVREDRSRETCAGRLDREWEPWHIVLETRMDAARLFSMCCTTLKEQESLASNPYLNAVRGLKGLLAEIANITEKAPRQPRHITSIRLCARTKDCRFKHSPGRCRHCHHNEGVGSESDTRRVLLGRRNF